VSTTLALTGLGYLSLGDAHASNSSQIVGDAAV
jgi:hypothetical protein